MKSRVPAIIIVLIITAFFCASGPTLAATIDDSDSLAGVKETKTLFDVSVSEPEKLEFYLRVIKRTYDGLVRQGQKPDMVIAFRGPSVLLINSETWSYSEEDEKILKQAAVLLQELKALDVRLEACSVATELFKVDNSTILPEIKVVGNTFISLTGYQMKGYALIPIH
ncbi:DsrE family protein [Desulfopila aestuarii]|uniref:Intracellular sulfur oxidation protein, DsrE/DsrF family n=1 Tax=Desulfopila aestuarii DSM 18488 TaxID=1121416 RepID=A0A1M7Y4M9_9BACT|nr:DsrE family protein [Desulfopila aestuarii]SHO47284.1 Intracellular sulfur oxidation protein, DsrE/DsrF family [Desulfopila aestuarii DSM 18488]